jgi:uncharacterized membrane protein
VSNKSTQTLLTIAIAAAVSLSSTALQAADANNMEKCYGIAPKGKNDCKAGPGTSCAGSAKIDYQSDAWKFVPQGTCEKTASPTSNTGFGQLKAFKEKKV